MINKVLAVAAGSSLAAMAFYAEGCGGSSQEGAADSGSDSVTIIHHPGGDTGGGGGAGGGATTDGGDSDAGVEMCEPGSVTGVKFGLNPSAASAGMCTPALIETIVDDCLGGDPDAGTDTCTQILQPHTAVYSCFYNCVSVNWTSSSTLSNYASTPWGGILNLLYASGGGFEPLNLGGCILAASGGNAAATTCAEDVEADLECDLQACGANCPLPAPTDPSFNEATTALTDCFGAADPMSDTGGECSKYSAAVAADCLADSGPVAAAVNLCTGLSSTINDPGSTLADYVQAWNQYLSLLCGPAAASDAGKADGGGITDGGDGG
jgi:hypothetical protein